MRRTSAGKRVPGEQQRDMSASFCRTPEHRKHTYVLKPEHEEPGRTQGAGAGEVVGATLRQRRPGDGAKGSMKHPRPTKSGLMIVSLNSGVQRVSQPAGIWSSDRGDGRA